MDGASRLRKPRSTRGWTELEQQAVAPRRSWSTDDLTSKDVQVFPDNLLDLVRQETELVRIETANTGGL